MENKKIKIYIISGKARHGKSTTAEIIKYFYKTRNKKVVEIAYAKYIKDYAMNISDWNGSDEKKPRELLQKLGTEVIRKKIDENFFVNRICEDIKVYSYFSDVIIISDARYEDEVEVPKQTFENVTTIRIINPNLETPLSISEQKHLSETGLDNYNNYDYIIINDQDIKELETKILNMIKEVDNEY